MPSSARRPAVVFPADIIMGLIDAAVIIFTYLLVQAAFSGLAYLLGGFLTESFTTLLADMPGFQYRVEDGRELGNPTWAVYEQLRWPAYIGIGITVVVAAVVRLLDSSGMLPGSEGGAGGEDGRTSRGDRMLFKCLAIAVFLAAFPLMWDVAAAAMESATAYVMNPHYSQNDGWPCAHALYDDPEAWERLYSRSPYIPGADKAVVGAFPAPDLLNPDGTYPGAESPISARGYERLCDPNLRFWYVMDHITGVPAYDLPDGSEPLEYLGMWSEAAATQAFSVAFFGSVRAMIVVQVALISLLSLILADLFTSMVIAAMPLLLVLGLIPQAKPTTDRLLLALPGMYMVPFITAIVITVGAGAVASAGDSPMGTESIGPLSGTVVYGWFVALGVLLMAASVPLMLIPLMGRVMGQVSMVVSSAASAAGMIAGRSAVGGMSGGAAGGGAGGVLSGMAGGAAGGAGAVLGRGSVGVDGGDKGGGGGGGGGGGLPNLSSILGGSSEGDGGGSSLGDAAGEPPPDDKD